MNVKVRLIMRLSEPLQRHYHPKSYVAGIEPGIALLQAGIGGMPNIRAQIKNNISYPVSNTYCKNITKGKAFG